MRDVAAPPPAEPEATVEAAYDELFARHWNSLVRLGRLLVDDTGPPSAGERRPGVRHAGPTACLTRSGASRG